MIIGQEALCERIDRYSLDTFPHTLMLVGSKGSGRHSLCNYVANKFNLITVDITDNSNEKEEIKENTNIDEFGKMDIRVATVLDCQPVKKSDRLLQFRLDDGMGGRTILSGIAQSYPEPSVLIGKQVLFIANFPPRKMMGIESQGMILSAVDADGKLVVTTVTAPVKNGSQVG